MTDGFSHDQSEQNWSNAAAERLLLRPRNKLVTALACIGLAACSSESKPPQPTPKQEVPSCTSSYVTSPTQTTFHTEPHNVPTGGDYFSLALLHIGATAKVYITEGKDVIVPTTKLEESRSYGIGIVHGKLGRLGVRDIRIEPAPGNGLVVNLPEGAAFITCQPLPQASPSTTA